MNAPNIAVYAGGPLGPSEISQNLTATQQAGWTTIILGLFHIGRPDIKGQNYDDIIFNDSMTISQGKYVMDPSWPGNVAALKQAGHSSVTKIYDGGSGNDPKDWAAAITQAIPAFSIDQFIVPGDWTEDSPSGVTSLFSTFAGEACLGGGFIWNMDGILSGSSKMADYVNAIKSAL